MMYNYLFDSDFPPGVASVFVGGKKISKEEFLKLKKKYLKKKKTIRMNLREFIQILLVLNTKHYFIPIFKKITLS